ncbi:hypothetical protein NQ317_017310 [Molorchus minor]|uniref:PPM-type phosphatase domain-containing protein n=1 Tax=Molorchus minor TaxID=1323400 RepID=A0ABQ9K1Y8_9CUCU|nr:hypothetical protein NQ317_017310 [Molorchus minor]
MPSLRKRVSSYFRQLSFHNETREKRQNINENAFVTKYLQGLIAIREGPPIVYGKNPTDLPNYELEHYESGPNTVIGCYTGPNGGLVTVKRTEKHLSLLDADIDFIDNHDEETGKALSLNNNCDSVECKNSLLTNDLKENTNDKTKESLEMLSSLSKEDSQTSGDVVKGANGVKTAVSKSNQTPSIEKESTVIRQKKPISVRQEKRESKSTIQSKDQSYGLSKSKSEGNPFHHKQKRGRIIKIDRPNIRGDGMEDSDSPRLENDDSILPKEWSRKSDLIYGLSDSLYDRNQVTRSKNGEKASIAAKCAVHGSLHYMNKTIFNDTKPFDDLAVKTDKSSISNNIINENVNLISNTREVFVCLLRAFNCAHDLILENNGMLTTLTVAVVLPLKQKLERRVPNPKAYIYSHKYGVRELTKGSHDISCNRDMRDALGALGPVDGISPELSNLTLSITTLHKGDIIMVASDGLTDNSDPNVCKFTVNSINNPTKQKRPVTNKPVKGVVQQQIESKHSVIPAVKTLENLQRPPVKPPRKHKKDDGRSSSERSSVKSATVSEKSSQSADSESSQEVQKVESKVIPQSNLDSTKKLAVEDLKTQELGKQSVHGGSNEEGNQNNFKDPAVDYENPLIQQFMRENSVEETTKIEKNLRRQATSQQRQENLYSSHKPLNQKSNTSSRALHTVDTKNSSFKTPDVGYKFLRSKTTLDIRTSNTKQIPRNEDGIPYVTPPSEIRTAAVTHGGYIKTWHIRIELAGDSQTNIIICRDLPCSSAKKLCENLLNFTMSITSAKRHTLEDQDLYFDNRNGVLVEVANQEKKIRRKRGLEKVQNLPGKLDHVTVVAYNVGNFAH